MQLTGHKYKLFYSCVIFNYQLRPIGAPINVVYYLHNGVEIVINFNSYISKFMICF